ncbi:ATP synthase subunit delta [Anatilimnocola aggregata]|uniref:ATP synthase subunit delta n=1 Tax=Anatilimnocola aggregata TaxID=2528021 RepID=A0A517YEQ7_9BACT|nr:ATP synthase F1 subunit delta [Anatilimnocola aggregata]QDU28713.1 ATP synthase subunit delta [Anatilimnocola aggregata]
MADTEQSESTFDAGREKLGLVYAKALFGAAESSGKVADVLEELESFQTDVLKKVPALRMTLSSPRIALEEKVALLDKAFAGKMSGVLLNFLKVLARHNRFECLADILKAYRKLQSEVLGQIEVSIRAAYPLSNPLRDRIAARLGEVLKRKVTLNVQIDPELLGGLVVRIGDTLYDGSVSSQLQRMKTVALQQTSQAIRDSLPRFTAT